MNSKIILLFLSIYIFCGFSYPDIKIQNTLALTGEIQNINADWQYFENNTKSPSDLKNLKNALSISLPHTWNCWDTVDDSPGYRRDAGWYQRKLFIKNQKEAQYLLYFESVNISSDIYVNGQHAGSHIGGYIGFEIDITKYVKKGQSNTITVRVDNGYNPDVIPSQKADFFIYGGITRDVWLKTLPPVNIKKVLVATPEVSAKSATTSLNIEINQADKITDNFTVHSKIIEAKTNKTVSEKTITAAELRAEKSIIFPEVKKPLLWSPKHPHLYKVVTTLLKDGKAIHEKTESIGYRWFDFIEHGAFLLNGEKLLLRGTHRHEEHAGYGAAMPNEMHRADIAQMKDVGVNFLRLGHYPQDPEVYRACDELGIIVWDELPWCRGGKGNKIWEENTERLFREQISQNYNHPSIFFWSIGNEIYWLPDFENGDDENELNTFVKKLNDVAHQLDPNRLTSIRKYYAGADLVDVFSPSIWSGWYAGVYTNYENTLSENHKKYPKFLHMEYGGSSHVGRHTETPIMGDGMLNEDDWAEVANQVGVANIAQSGDWTENYIVDLFDWYLSVTETQENFTGNAQWAFKDFGTPLRPENAVPYLNQKGLVDRDGKPKDAYYVFKSYWSDEPFIYIESHTWTERRGPANKPREVSVFSNCEEVELFHNGKSLGIKKRVLGKFPACGLNWEVAFTEGKNKLTAKSTKKGKLIASDILDINYSFEQSKKADHIDLSSRMLPNGNYLVEAKMMDKDGLRVLDYEKNLYFSKDGNGELLVNYGTPTRSRVIQMANGYAAIELSPAESGKAVIEARNQDFKGSYHTIDFAKGKKKTQALLLTQPFAYDANDKNKMTEAYVAQNKITVPNELAGQNKWIMFEGPVLENDKIAYRYYADSRHRFDIYGKTVEDLVMDTVSWQYHDIMDWGSDVLKVGNSLGIGSPAIWYQDSVYTLSDYREKTIEVIETGGNKSTIRTIFKGLTIDGKSFDLQQDWSIETGQAATEIHLKVLNGKLPKGMSFATGIVKHLPEITQGENADYFYAMNWGKQSYHKENMGMAVLAEKKYQAAQVADDLSHVYTFKNANKEVRYRFLAAWERDNNKVKNTKEFEKLVRHSCQY